MSCPSPQHIGIILDGNRRFAKKIMLQPWKGHQWGKEKVKQLLEWSKELGIHELTLYAFSLQNFSRPQEEFDQLMKLFKESFQELLIETDKLKELRVRFIGRTKLFPQDVQDIISEIEERTKDHLPYKLNIAMAYGGREEITDAVKVLARKVQEKQILADDITEKDIEEHLMLSSTPDMIIRTGGEHRTSNFLAWQSIYSEWFFLDKMWPEFEKEDVETCIKVYVQRERRFGR